MRCLPRARAYSADLQQRRDNQAPLADEKIERTTGRSRIHDLHADAAGGKTRHVPGIGEDERGAGAKQHNFGLPRGHGIHIPVRQVGDGFGSPWRDNLMCANQNAGTVNLPRHLDMTGTIRGNAVSVAGAKIQFQFHNRRPRVQPVDAS